MVASKLLQKIKSKPQYKRILIKISGEALMGDCEYGIDPHTVERLAKDLKAVIDMGVEVCIVLGAGNIFRGVSGAAAGMDRATADYMGMLAIVINALAFQNAIEKLGLEARVLSAIPIDSVCEPFIRRRALAHMEKGRVVIFAAGIGSPFVTSDTAAALRAAEMNCEVILKATRVDGVYDSDPEKNPKAKRFNEISFQQVLAKNLKVMDAGAVALARDSNIPLIVFSLNKPNAFADVVCGKGAFTIIRHTED